MPPSPSRTSTYLVGRRSRAPPQQELRRESAEVRIVGFSVGLRKAEREVVLLRGLRIMLWNRSCPEDSHYLQIRMVFFDEPLASFEVRARSEDIVNQDHMV